MAESTPDRVKILKKAKVLRCIQEGGKVTGVEYEKDGKKVSRPCCQYGTVAETQYTEHGTVILATGGYAADFTPNSLLKKHRPEYYDLVSRVPLGKSALL